MVNAIQNFGLAIFILITNVSFHEEVAIHVCEFSHFATPLTQILVYWF